MKHLGCLEVTNRSNEKSKRLEAIPYISYVSCVFFVVRETRSINSSRLIV
jgi:hypothetical protein